MEKYILAVDQGTTGTTTLILNEKIEILGKYSVEIPPVYPQAGWVEHDLNLLYASTLDSMRGAIQQASIDCNKIAAIGITNQRETVGFWPKSGARPAQNAIVWQCRRTADYCETLKNRNIESTITEKTGLILDPYFSGSKINWFLQNTPNLKKQASQGDILFGTIDTYLLWRFTNGEAFATDVTNASRTLLMNINSLSWDQELLDIFEVPRCSLPEIKSNSEIYGRTKAIDFLPDGIPISALFGDQQAALFGQLCLEPGETKITYGTGSFLLMNIGEKPKKSNTGLLTTVAWKIDHKVTYAFEGSVFMAGASVQWLRDGLGLIQSAGEIENLARMADDKGMGDLVFVPALTGLGAPHWKANATGTITGITRSTTKEHLARATLEGIAMQNDDVLSAMASDLDHPISRIKVDGGAAENDFLMQLQCDLADIEVDRPDILETTALGSGLAAGLAVGVWTSIDDLKSSWQLNKRFTPKMPQEERKSRKDRWKKAIRACSVFS